jgi:uncharacterized protein (TIGR02466 family)
MYTRSIGTAMTKKKQKVKIQESENLENWLFFPTLVYKITKTNFLESVKTVAYEQIDKIEKKSTGKPSVHQSENIYLDPRLDEFSKYVADTAWNILSSQGHRMEGKFTSYKEMWAQEIEQYAFMPYHVHGSGNQISGFYFLNCPEDASKVIIYDPRPGKVQINLEETDVSKATYASSMCNFTPEPGMLIFFNSWLPHAFGENLSADPLRFIHFNLSIVENSTFLPMSQVDSAAPIVV